jgi:aminopeptidase
MDLEKQIQNYAVILLTKGINLQKNQILVLQAPVEAHRFVTILTKAAYKQGSSQVIISWRSDAVSRLRYEYEALGQFQTLPDWRRDFSLYYYRKGAAFLSLVSADPYLMDGVDPEKIFAQQKAQHTALREYIDGMMASRVTWLVAAVPSTVWASLLFPQDDAETAKQKLWQCILKASRADGKEPEMDWDHHLARLQKRRQWLTAQHFQKLHYEAGNGTDLWIDLPQGHIWQGGAEEATNHLLFNANIPTEEVYTAPHCDGVNGIVYNTKPLVYNGVLIDQFCLTFKDGKVISAKAKTGEDVLQQLLTVDDGAGHLGEVALVPYHSPISLSNVLYYETLFDENASCHLALGKAYPSCLRGGTDLSEEELHSSGLNDSLAHVDFMIGTLDLTITGIDENGQEIPVFRHGDFATIE